MLWFLGEKKYFCGKIGKNINSFDFRKLFVSEKIIMSFAFKNMADFFTLNWSKCV
jgi:hypothetical protein